MHNNRHNSLQFTKVKDKNSKAVYLVLENQQQSVAQNVFEKLWLQQNGFTGKAGQFLLMPQQNGEIAYAAFGLGNNENAFAAAKLAEILPEGRWHFSKTQGENIDNNDFYHYLALAFGAYRFQAYLSKKNNKNLQIYVPESIDFLELNRQKNATFMVRDLINQPANAMMPDNIEQAVRTLGKAYGAEVKAIIGDALLEQNFPLIYAVGKASSIAPRLIELRFGNKNHKKLTLIGKGVSFDTGGLDIKTPNGMVLMKKDMGGAANVLGLAQMIMDAKLPFYLRVLIPAVENSISSQSFRPSDILKSRQGLTVEIGNTDAEGRLILADALTYGDEEKPHLMFDMATLTGAARVALGPDLPPFYCNVHALAQKIAKCAHMVHDPLWQMPLWPDYNKKLSSNIADLNNVGQDGFAGSITAALFLQHFVKHCQNWAHFDIYGWTPSAKAGFPKGGEAQGIRALYHLLASIK